MNTPPLPASPVSSPRAFAVIVEDDGPTRGLLLRLLRSRGYLPHAFARAEDALSWLSTQSVVPALLSVDLDLPGHGGAGLCQALRAMPRFAQVPIVVVSGRANRGTAQALGVNAALPKPLDLAAYLAELQRLAPPPSA